MAAFPSRDWDAFVAHQKKIDADPEVLQRTVVADGVVAGSIGSWQADVDRDIGYWIGRDFWGRGVGTAALRAPRDRDEAALTRSCATSARAACWRSQVPRGKEQHATTGSTNWWPCFETTCGTVVPAPERPSASRTHALRRRGDRPLEAQRQKRRIVSSLERRCQRPVVGVCGVIFLAVSVDGDGTLDDYRRCNRCLWSGWQHASSVDLDDLRHGRRDGAGRLDARFFGWRSGSGDRRGSETAFAILIITIAMHGSSRRSTKLADERRTSTTGRSRERCSPIEPGRSEGRGHASSPTPTALRRLPRVMTPAWLS